ncbi:hypothetical protein [Leptothermofonsia sp. ETS-13]|uniref:hypothetical protein n=1 Tax=Leptothermofonsia sp. ETS-13 TaxID=3035696 RepID=UPI003BA11964
MKQNLKRIEAALHQLATKRSDLLEASIPSRIDSDQVLTVSTSSSSSPNSVKASLPTLPILPVVELKDSSTETSHVPKEGTVEPLSTSLSEVKTPALPRLKTPSFSSHRNAANPTLAMGLLKEMETIVAGWQEELQQVLRQIQDLYLEGPIVDGWLESYAHQDGEAPEFRHADVDCLMDYVEKMRAHSQKEPLPTSTSPYGEKLQSEANAAGYRLCGLNEDGQLWFRHCPAEQVPAVGMAIARYQRLRLLLSRKQYLETRLEQLAETLVMVHSRLNA